jgi:hypothetical protein
MDYLPPLDWPPPPEWDPPNDMWKPPPGWRPRTSGAPISPEGESYLLRPPPGSPSHERPEPDEDEQARLNKAVATRMLALWARTLMSSAHSYYQAACRAAWTDRAIEYGEDWSPTTDDLRKALDQVWVRGYFLVMAAFQMERWLSAYDPDSDEAKAGAEHLQALRNSLEHLDGATFSEYSARKTSSRRAYSIDRLPGRELFLGFSSAFIDEAFGVVNLKEVTDRARGYMHIDEPPEPDWADSWG